MCTIASSRAKALTTCPSPGTGAGRSRLRPPGSAATRTYVPGGIASKCSARRRRSGPRPRSVPSAARAREMARPLRATSSDPVRRRRRVSTHATPRNVPVGRRPGAACGAGTDVEGEHGGDQRQGHDGAGSDSPPVTPLPQGPVGGAHGAPRSSAGTTVVVATRGFEAL